MTGRTAAAAAVRLRELLPEKREQRRLDRYLLQEREKTRLQGAMETDGGQPGESSRALLKGARKRADRESSAGMVSVLSGERKPAGRFPLQEFHGVKVPEEKPRNLPARERDMRRQLPGKKEDSALSVTRGRI